MSWDHRQSIKEVIRHVAHKVGGDGLLKTLRRSRGIATSHLGGRDPAERFNEIYRTGAWIETGDQIARSGEGSELEATESVRKGLPALLRKLECRKLVDVGCGDWNWIKNVDLPCEYLGIDIVSGVIEANYRAYHRPGVAFDVVDAIAGPIPAADVVLCREVLFHLSFKDAKSVLSNVRKSARWLVATTDPSIWFNSDIPTGDFRKINLERSPYRLPHPRRSVPDDRLSRGRILGVWLAEELPLY